VKDAHLMMHGIAVKKFCRGEEICSLTQLSSDNVRELLEDALSKGRVAEVDGKYMLTPAGQVLLRSSYARACSALREDSDFMSAYEDFEKINNDLKQAITDWQTLTIGGQKVPNDHSDAAYDDSVIDRVGRIHDTVDGILKRLGKQLPRLNRYNEKLLEALEKAEDGDIQWISDAKSESYHTLWFELHEDLLRLVGREREE
jgi:hypothetical protein